MSGVLPEKDWKYLRSIEKELLSDLCGRINRSAAEIVNSAAGSEHEKYLALYKHIEASDRIVADCFNGWRRSDIDFRLRLLQLHNLLTEEHLCNLSDVARGIVERYKGNSSR